MIRAIPFGSHCRRLGLLSRSTKAPSTVVFQHIRAHNSTSFDYERALEENRSLREQNATLEDKVREYETRINSTFVQTSNDSKGEWNLKPLTLELESPVPSDIEIASKQVL